MTALLAEMQGEHTRSGVYDFETHCSKLAINLTLFEPAEGVIPLGRTILFIPGLAAKRRVYNEGAVAASNLGYHAITVGHEGGGPDGVRAITRALVEIDEGVVGGKQLSIEDPIFIDAHSLGFRKAVKSIESIKNERDHPARDRFDHVIGHAAACLGGVRKPALYYVMRSIQDEVRYMGKGSLKHKAVALEGLEYIAKLSPLRLGQELIHATFGQIERDVRSLQDQGVRFAGIDHPEDLLIDPIANTRFYERLGIPHLMVDAPHAGHNAQLYHPQEVMAAVDETVTGLMK